MSLDEYQSDPDDDCPSSADDDLDSEKDEQIPDVDASDDVIPDSNPTSRRAFIETGGPLVDNERPGPAVPSERDDRLLKAAQTLAGGDAESQPNGQGISPASVSYSSNLRSRSKEFDCVGEAETLTEKGGLVVRLEHVLAAARFKDAETAVEGGKDRATSRRAID